ncbi:MAG: nascent polypeptide-associated complex protein [Candidatus Altiarchaeota archaeon]|nr:nascent polypeptide-associated complex protein [Candidatus Altiarchaeota archaeon]
MFPGGLNPRQMKQMMKQMGIKTEEIDATAVVIIGPEKETVIENPEVVKMTVSGKDMFTISGGTVKVQEVEAEVEISEEDVEMVSEQAGVGKDKAKKTLEECKGDIAEAIMRLKG